MSGVDEFSCNRPEFFNSWPSTLWPLTFIRVIYLLKDTIVLSLMSVKWMVRTTFSRQHLLVDYRYMLKKCLTFVTSKSINSLTPFVVCEKCSMSGQKSLFRHFVLWFHQYSSNTNFRGFCCWVDKRNSMSIGV